MSGPATHDMRSDHGLLILWGGATAVQLEEAAYDRRFRPGCVSPANNRRNPRLRRGVRRWRIA